MLLWSLWLWRLKHLHFINLICVWLIFMKMEFHVKFKELSFFPHDLGLCRLMRHLANIKSWSCKEFIEWHHMLKAICYQSEGLTNWILSHWCPCLLALAIGKRLQIGVGFGNNILAWTWSMCEWHLEYYVWIWWMGMCHRSACIKMRSSRSSKGWEEYSPTCSQGLIQC